jgi:adenylate cyclase
MPLKLKLSLLITSLLALTVVLVSTFLLRQQQKTLTAEITKRGLTIAQNLADSAKNPVLIVDENGKVLAHSEVGLVGRPFERAASLKPLAGGMLVQTYEVEGKGDLLDFSAPLTFRNVTVGALYLGFSQGSIAAALHKARNNAILISLGMVMIGIGGAVALASFLSAPILKLMEGTRAVAAGNFAVSLPVPSRDEIGDLTQSFNQMAQSLREKDLIKRAFTRYVAREVVDEILKDPENLVLTGERRDVTVLFCDIRGFTSTSEKLTPEEVVTLLNTFYTLMIDTTFKEDGTLDKFLGDGVMAVFGAPIYHQDHSLRAIRTALAMQAGMRDLSARRATEGKPPIAVGIGINAGDAVAGTVGTEARMEYTVIGDSVNLASRLESNSKAGQILISEQTYRKVQAAVEARSLGRIKVKGKEDEIGVYEVIRMRSA